MPPKVSWKLNLAMLWFSQLVILAGFQALIPFIPLFIKNELGVTDEESLLLCAALYQLRGAAVAEQIIKGAGDAPGKETLLQTIKDLQPGLYRTCCLLVE